MENPSARRQEKEDKKNTLGSPPTCGALRSRRKTRKPKSSGWTLIARVDECGRNCHKATAMSASLKTRSGLACQVGLDRDVAIEKCGRAD